MKSREEIRFLALLNKSQEKAASLKNKESDKISAIIEDEWRVPKFVETLEDWLVSLETHPQGPTKEVLIEYRSKVDFLKKVLESRIEKENKAQPQLYKKVDVVDVAGGTRRRSLRSTSPPNVSEIIQPSMPIIPHGPSTTNQPITQEIHQKTMESHHEKLRSELFGLNDGNLRKRNLQDVPNDLDDLMKDHQESQEQVAEEMLSLTKTLKEQTIAAKEVIQKDTQKIEKANEVVDKNTEKLKKENERLQEHTKNSCRCWIWLLLMIVTFTFIAMVWIMKFFRKRSDY